MKEERPQNKHLNPPFEARDEARELGKIGGLKSGQKRRELKEIREWLERDLFAEINDPEGAKGAGTGRKAETFKVVFGKLKNEALRGNVKAIETYLNYAGLKPVDKIEALKPLTEVNVNAISLEKLRELREKLEGG
jgi:hypothetical protein